MRYRHDVVETRHSTINATLVKLIPILQMFSFYSVERPRNHTAQIETLGPDDKPLSSKIPEHDPKWRFFWRIGPVPKKTNFPLLNMDAVIPPEIPEWSSVMDAWGNKMLDAMNTVAEMAALGFNLKSDAFTSRLRDGPHLLAPTGSDYNIFNKEGTVLAGYHYDLNFLTIHGKSRYPGLYIWTRKGKRVAVSVPEGCLLVQVRIEVIFFLWLLCFEFLSFPSISNVSSMLPMIDRLPIANILYDIVRLFTMRYISVLFNTIQCDSKPFSTIQNGSK